ncbi:MAG: SGNH/GDSL hydrolase family protein [Clostridiales bacterium]|nr:SGNH/GDSL hydrolase family protein [Clostridiales bacterium]
MKILFFGDSITAGGRDPNNLEDLGNGYVKIAAGKLRLLYPDKDLQFVNRGVGGDRTEHLVARLNEDVIAETPDVVILQIGINDAWHRFIDGTVVSPEKFRENYEQIVTAIKCTGAKLIIVQPYVLNMGDKARLRPFVNEFNAIIREIADEDADAFIPMDEIFTGLARDTGADQFAEDGVHPTHRGCRYIADRIILKLEPYLK